MPRIPQLEPGGLGGATTPRPPISPESFAAPGRALAAAGEEVGGALQDVAGDILRAREKEDNAERTLKALEISRQLDQDALDYVETLQDRQDYEKFEPDTDQHNQEIAAKYTDQIGGDKALQILFERKYNQTSLQISQVAKRRKLEVMTERALGAFETSYNESLQNYAGSPDPEMREIIKGDLELQTAQLVASGFMTQEQAESSVQSFEDESEQVRADQLIEADPTLAEEMLKTGDFDTLDPKIRQQKIEKAQIRQKAEAEAERQAIAAEEKRKKIALKEAHDQEEKTVGELFLSEDYDAVVPALMQTEHLTGDELRIWSDASRAKIENMDKVIDPDDQNQALVTVNAMIARGEDPTEIRNFIITNPDLTPENQEQYLSKLETKLGGAMDEGRKSGYRVISAMLAPKADPVAGIFTTPLDTAAAALAQGDLDEWLDREKADGRSPSMQEIRSKSISFASGRTVPFAAKIEFIKRQAKAAQLSVNE
ncbi:MAG: hypothetical protein KAJ10_03555 [Thermodesulfovibrionia bacterium]|nr:hypothetical protein [Thermodesulfovibrionia bacterium]